MEINTKDQSKKKVATRQSEVKHLHPNYKLPKAYTGTLPISKAKKKDLISLCEELTIPKQYHTFYQGLLTEGDRNVGCNNSTEDDVSSDSTNASDDSDDE